MTADSVPAPMVQLPAALDLVSSHAIPVDAATPAASIPAAEILALADKWQAKAESLRTYTAEHDDDGEHHVRRTAATMTLGAANELRDHIAALVAAAEQADKGEAADTPRFDDDLFDDLRGHPDDTPMSGEAATQYAPAAPVGEPLCRCGLVELAHRRTAPYSPSAAEFARGCSVFTPARVPVNDEAEANCLAGDTCRCHGNPYRLSPTGDDTP